MAAREGLAFEPPPDMDSAPLVEAVLSLRCEKIVVRAVRDATRGGLSAVLQQWTEASNTTIVIDEQTIHVTDTVRGACELLGIDPLHVANEGIMVIAVSKVRSQLSLAALRTVAEPS